MQSIFTIIASALVASNMANAAPAWNTTNSCNSSSVIACCNTNEISAPNSGILSQVLGGSCVLPNLLALGNNCPGASTYCCPVSQKGLINVAATCDPVTL